MAIRRLSDHKSVHQLAFDHYLRTGERLTSREWLARFERKFNPYHDEIGRFTSPPGVTVSYGARHNQGVVGPRRPATPGRASPRANAISRVKPHMPALPQGAGDPAASDPSRSAGTFRSEFVRTAVAPETNHAETFFELNKRQAYLDRLRQEAGPKPAADVKADMEDFQMRLDADRARLQARVHVIDLETAELLRAGLAPVDIGLGAINIGSGKGEVRDYLSVAGAVPIGGTIGKLAKAALARRATEKVAEGAFRKVIQLGGAHRDIKGMPGYEAHHMPGKAVSPHSEGDGPAIAMLKEDHRQLPTSRRGPEGDAFRRRQSEHISRGDFASAIQMEIDLVRSRYGARYDDAIEQMLKFSRERGFRK